MNDRELDRLIEGASPVRNSDVHGLDLACAEDELKEQIMTVDLEALPDVQERRRPVRRVVTSAAGLAALCLIVAGILTSGGKTEYLPMARAVAESNLRILPGTPGWKVTRADEFLVDQGEMTFGDGRQSLDVSWEPAFTHGRRVEQAHREGESVEHIRVLGRNATMWRYKGTTDYVTMVEPEGKTGTYIRGDLGSAAAYRHVLDGLRQVSVDEWLAAMPASVVKPADRATTVDAMLRDIPRPPGFDATTLRSGDAVKDRYQLGAQVSGAVACGWIDRWFDGKQKSDTAEVDAATAAMATSRRWAVLRDMDPEGDYPEVLWSVADAMAGKQTIATGKGPIGMDATNARGALGCDAPAPH